MRSTVPRVEITRNAGNPARNYLGESGYNSNDQVTSITLVGSPNVTILSGITYDPFGPVTV
jgi:hypothetical protein